MDIDEDVMSSALEWLAKQQQVDGSFGEPGEVHHKAMQVKYSLLQTTNNSF